MASTMLLCCLVAVLAATCSGLSSDVPPNGWEPVCLKKCREKDGKSCAEAWTDMFCYMFGTGKHMDDFRACAEACPEAGSAPKATTTKKVVRKKKKKAATTVPPTTTAAPAKKKSKKRKAKKNNKATTTTTTKKLSKKQIKRKEKEAKKAMKKALNSLKPVIKDCKAECEDKTPKCLKACDQGPVGYLCRADCIADEVTCGRECVLESEPGQTVFHGICPAVECPKECPHGFLHRPDNHGCTLCECAGKPECAVPQCNCQPGSVAVHGSDKYGCGTCWCSDPKHAPTLAPTKPPPATTVPKKGPMSSSTEATSSSASTSTTAASSSSTSTENVFTTTTTTTKKKKKDDCPAVPRDCTNTCKPGTKPIKYYNDKGCEECSCALDFENKHNDPSTSSSSSTTTTAPNKCPPLKPCHCGPKEKLVFRIDAFGCEGCLCI